jgi:hypothetical protein
MGLQLSSVGYGKIIGGALFFAALGLYQAYEGVNHALNYAEVPATVTAVKPLCAFDIDSPLYSGEMRWSACGTQVELSGEELNRQKIVLKREVDFAFTSPADNRAHVGTFTLHGRSSKPVLNALHDGATGNIWASDDNPLDYHYHSWPFVASAQDE